VDKTLTVKFLIRTSPPGRRQPLIVSKPWPRPKMSQSQKPRFYRVSVFVVWTFT